MSSRVKLDEIARLAGVSPAQASRAINGLDLVSPETRRRVLEIARAKNYRNLAINHTIRIAVCHTSALGIYDAAMLHCLYEEIRRRGWISMSFNTGDEKEVRDFFFDGVVFLSSNDAYIAANWHKEYETPAVVINGFGSELGHVSTVDSDMYGRSRLVLEHLLGLGHRRIACLQWTGMGNKRLKDRGSKEFLDCARELGVGATCRNVFFQDDHEFLLQLRKLKEEHYTGFFVLHMRMTVRAARAFHPPLFRCPEEASLITLEAPEVSEFLTPAMTTVDYDYAKIASTACNVLENRIKNRPEKFQVSYKIPNRLIVRESTGPAPKKF